MNAKVLTDKSLLRVKAIHSLSQKYNVRLGNKHTLRLLELAKEHVEEIQQLYQVKNDHYIVETGDLIILCLEVLLESKTSVDKTLLKCFDRYEKRFASLANEG